MGVASNVRGNKPRDVADKPCDDGRRRRGLRDTGNQRQGGGKREVDIAGLMIHIVGELMRSQEHQAQVMHFVFC